MGILDLSIEEYTKKYNKLPSKIAMSYSFAKGIVDTRDFVSTPSGGGYHTAFGIIPLILDSHVDEFELRGESNG
jgi:hypothetical protein